MLQWGAIVFIWKCENNDFGKSQGSECTSKISAVQKFYQTAFFRFARFLIWIPSLFKFFDFFAFLHGKKDLKWQTIWAFALGTVGGVTAKFKRLLRNAWAT